MEKELLHLGSSIEQFYDYLTVFSVMPPRGEEAKAESIKEFEEIVNCVIGDLKVLEKKQIELIEAGDE